MIASAELIRWPLFRHSAGPARLKPARRAARPKSAPKTGKRRRITQKMLADLRERRRTVDDLRAMPETKLVATYGRGEGAGRTTVRGARAAALSEFDGAATPPSSRRRGRVPSPSSETRRRRRGR
jgi:hypothetical protein